MKADSADRKPGKVWHESPLRVTHTILRTKDVDGYSADAYVEYALRQHADAIVINGGGLLAFYPTKVPGHPIVDGLSQDIVGDVVGSAHRAGLKVLGRVDFRGAAPEFFAQRPEWFARDEEGAPRLTAAGLHTCAATSPYRTEGFAFEVVRELLREYPLDGIWENAAGFLHYAGGGFYDGPAVDVLELGASAASFGLVDYSATTARRFKEDTGRELPRPDPFSAEDYFSYLEWRYSIVRERSEQFRAEIKAAGEDLAYVAEAPGVLNVWTLGNAQDLVDLAPTWDISTAMTFDLTRGSYGSELRPTPVWGAEETAQYLWSVNRPVPPTIMFGRFDNQSRYATVAPDELKVWLAGAVAHGAGMWETTFVGAHDGDFLDQRCGDIVRNAYATAERLRPYSEGAATLAEVAVVHSRRTQDALASKDPDRDRYIFHVRGAMKALYESHVPFDLIPDTELTSGALDRYRALVLPNLAVLDDTQCAALREYVRRGGAVVATSETSRRTSAMVERDGYGLGDVFGVVQHEGVAVSLSNAFGIVEERGALTAGLESTQVVTTEGDVQLVRVADDARVPLTLIEQIVPQPPERGWIADMTSTVPLMVTNEFGAGRSAYFAGQIDRQVASTGHPDHARLIVNAVRWACSGEELLTTDAPPSVHVSLVQQPEHRRTLLHLLNYTSGPGRPIQQIVPCRDLHVSLRLPEGSVRRVTDPLDDAELPFEVVDGRLELRIDHLDVHAVVLVEMS